MPGVSCLNCERNRPKAGARGKVIAFPYERLGVRPGFSAGARDICALPDGVAAAEEPVFAETPVRSASRRTRKPLVLPELADVSPAPKRPQKQRESGWQRWGSPLYGLAAWLIAADRLQQAVARGEVFGALDMASFFVAVIVPIVALHGWLERTTRKARELAAVQKCEADSCAAARVEL